MWGTTWFHNITRYYFIHKLLVWRAFWVSGIAHYDSAFRNTSTHKAKIFWVTKTTGELDYKVIQYHVETPALARTWSQHCTVVD